MSGAPTPRRDPQRNNFRGRRRWLGPLALGVAVGLLMAGGGKAALDATNSTAFCISCHEMKANNHVEYSQTVHARNRSGVVAGCPDCHVPHEFPDILWRKIGASNDLVQHWLGRIDTPEKFEAHRLELATQVWLRMKRTDSRECRHCHDAQAMASDLQGKTAQKQHKRIGVDGKTCIDCHFGIAHKEPAGGHEPSEVLTTAASGS